MLSSKIKELTILALSLSALLLLNSCGLTRTLESESLEEEIPASEVNSNSNAIRYVKGTHPVMIPPLEGESAENHVKYHRLPPPQQPQIQETGETFSSNAINRRGNTNSNSNNNNKKNYNSFNNNQEEGIGGDSGPKCLTCGASQQNEQLESSLPESTVRAMRLEMVKQQILKKLRLKDPPKSENIPKDQTPLPTPVTLGDTLPRKKSRGSQYYYSGDRDVEDFYGKTEQVIVFPEDVIPGCGGMRDYPMACFLFNLPKEIHTEEISSAELWVFKLPDGNDEGKNQTFWISEILKGSGGDPLESSSRQKIIDIKTNIRQRHGWMSLNILNATLRWLRARDYEQSVQIGCKTCAMDVGESPIGSLNEKRPFMVFNIASVSRKKRTRRYVNCSPGVTECCRERFVVDFREIGWDLVISPLSYEAFYCKGSCINLGGFTQSTSRRTSMVQNYLAAHGVNNRTRELVPCCTATKMSSISMAYRDPRAMNSTVKVETLPNMVIESCGCL